MVSGHIFCHIRSPFQINDKSEGNRHLFPPDFASNFVNLMFPGLRGITDINASKSRMCARYPVFCIELLIDNLVGRVLPNQIYGLFRAFFCYRWWCKRCWFIGILDVQSWKEIFSTVGYQRSTRSKRDT